MNFVVQDRCCALNDPATALKEIAAVDIFGSYLTGAKQIERIKNPNL